MKMNTKEMGQALQGLFGETAEIEARETQFVQRESKLTGVKFLQTFVLGFVEEPTASLNVLSQVAADLGVDISPQGLQKRLSNAAVSYMQKMFERSKESLQNKVPIPLTLLTQFTAVQLVDSSGIALPNSLADEFPGAGGSGPEAGMKLQTIWEFLRGNLTAVWQTTAREPDQSVTEHVSYVTKGALFLCDLGYFNLTSMGQIKEGGAYFVSRLDTQCVLLNPIDQERFDLYTHLRKAKADRIELNLLIGAKAQLACRVLAVRLPPEVVAERRRKAKANAKRKGRTLSAEKLAWLAWGIYITNAPDYRLSLRQVVLIYTLRWQIELLFKLWKSEAQLDRVAGIRRERVLCEIYAKLIGVVIFHFLTAPVRWAERELSPTKALQTFRRHVLEIAQSLDSLSDLSVALDKLFSRWQRFGLKDKRRQRVSTSRRIDLAAVQSLG